jgi:hypothetical protein
MRFWNRLSESEVEHTLRARRPQPTDDLVHSISRSVASSHRRSRGAAPKLALVGAVTVVLAASLGVTGALGYCGGSVKSFGHGVTQLVSYHDDHHSSQGGNGGPKNTGHDNHGSKGDDHHGGNGGNNGNGGGNGNGNGGNGNGNGNGHGNGGNGGGNGNGNGNGNGGNGNGGGNGDHGGGPPFDHQYGHGFIPVCYQGHLILIRPQDLLWFFYHGAGPPWECSNGHGGKHGH